MNHLRTPAILAFALCLLTLSPCAQTASPNDLANVEVLIVRHAERQGKEDKLTDAGLARAAAYAQYFKALTIEGRPVHLTHLFAEQSARTRGTLAPLSKSVGLPLDTRFVTKQYAALAEDLRSHSYGKEILICWHHKSIPKLIESLGGDPSVVIPGGKWPGKTYDWLIDLRFDAQGKLTPSRISCIHEHLMPGDPK
jgi:phosphohistidine phosphatase SixA